MEMVITDGDDLKAQREDRGLSQAKLAELAGISHASRHVYKIETGASKPTLKTALKLSRALMTPVTQARRRDSLPPHTSPQEETCPTKKIPPKELKPPCQD